MNQPASVFFTGMDPMDAEQLCALFNDINRRTGNRWTLAGNGDEAEVLVIDVDTLYGHMTWLRAQTTGQTIVALTQGESQTDADFSLRRPVTVDAMRRLLQGLQAGGQKADAPRPGSTMAAEPAPAPAIPVAHEPRPEARSAPEATSEPVIAVTAHEPATAAAPPVEVPAEAAVPRSPSSKEAPAERKLIDALLDGSIPAGPQRLDLAGLAPLALDVAQKIFLCGNGIKSYLPHTRIALEDGNWATLTDGQFNVLREELGGSQPLGRLVWLAALGGSDGMIVGGRPGARYRLSRWPQVEREFPRHFRIATTMMKGFQTPEEISGISGAALDEVNDFISASLVTGFAEIEPEASAEDSAPAPPRSLLERLRRAR